MYELIIGAMISVIIGNIAAVISRLKGDEWLLVFQSSSIITLISFIIYCIYYAYSLNIQ